MPEVKVSDYSADFLAAQGVTQVYELVGGMIVHIIDSIHQAGKIELVSVRHEQAAAFAADPPGDAPTCRRWPWAPAGSGLPIC